MRQRGLLHVTIGWKVVLVGGVAVTVFSPLGLIGLTTAGLVAHGGPDCLAALASPPPSPVASPSPGSLWSRCDGGDGMPDDTSLPTSPGGYQPPNDPRLTKVVAFALAQVGKPYVFGAAGPDAWDCSGLVLMAWRQVGVHLSHSTYYMVDEGVSVPSIQAMQPGDLIFIPGSDGTRQHPGHVGMYIGLDAHKRRWLVQAPHTHAFVKTTQVDAWAGSIVRIVRPVLPVDSHRALAP
jgi:cell wall-associated NlpC family hydrolase